MNTKSVSCTFNTVNVERACGLRSIHAHGGWGGKEKVIVTSEKNKIKSQRCYVTWREP